MVLRRLRDGMVVLFLVLLAVFILGTMVGHPEETLAPADATQEQVDAIRDRLGLNDPFVTQVGRYFNGLAHLDLGESLTLARGEDAMSLVFDRVPATFKLTLAGIFFSILIGVVTGIAAGVRPGSLFDKVSGTVAMVLVSFPYFWFGMVLIIVVAVNLRWVPVLADDRQWQSYLLPGITLGMHHGGRLFQLCRSATFDELNKSYVTVATAKGLPYRLVILKHILRNIGVVVATTVGWEYARMWGGTAFLAEFVFAWPGIGKLVTDAAGKNDLRVIEAGVVVAGVFVVLSNLVVDVVYSLIDKRVQVS